MFLFYFFTLQNQFNFTYLFILEYSTQGTSQIQRNLYDFMDIHCIVCMWKINNIFFSTFKVEVNANEDSKVVYTKIFK